jgi:hypothetical protein
MIQNPTKVLVEAGEILLTKDEMLTPVRLHKLASEGWSITHATGDKDFSKVFVVRWPKSKETKVTLGVHNGSSRCPQYCSCLVETGQEELFTV